MNNLLSSAGAWIFDFLYHVSQLQSSVVLLVVLLVVAVMVLDSTSLAAKNEKKEVGVAPQAITVSVDGSKTLPVRNYISEIQGIAGRPDALISEEGYIIPIERKPLAKKLRDRYVAQLLVYMRLVEEFEGKKPPYGYLILGPKCRTFKIVNSDERQQWLQGMLDSMRGIIDGASSRPLPDVRKCSKCFVRDHCQHVAKPSPRAHQ